MSLFKSRKWWSTQCGNDEQFEKSSFVVTRVNSNYQYVIVGSHSGVLRIYQPTTEKQDDGHVLGYVPNDLIIEIQLSYPILQICVGRLVSGSQIMQLAILHPKSVGVYSLVTKSGIAEHGNQNNLLLVYEHALKRSCSNLLVGPFGGSVHRDFMCIQSLDGMLTFFEQEIFSFCCFLPDFLLPGPLAFIKSTDSFVTISSNWQIESFSYKRLSENQNLNQTDVEGKKCDADWIYNLGENIVDIAVVESGTNETSILILGERNMFCLADSGKLKFMKRFDFSPQCFYPYYISKIFMVSGTNSKLMSLVVSETNTLLVFENTTLRWSAQLSFLPIAISRGFFGSIDGTLVLLSDSGLLQFCYLGTEPQLFTAPPLQNHEIDFENTEQELNKLNKIIKSHRNNDISLVNAATENDLILNANISPHLEPCTFQHEIKMNSEEDVLPMCLVTVELVPNVPFEEVQVSLIVEQPIKIYPNIHFISNLEDKVILDSYVYLWKPLEIVILEVKIIVSHIATTGVPRILSKKLQLPMKLAYTVEPPFKEANHKVTLNINEQAPALSVLFPEYIGEQALAISSSVVCFKTLSGAGSPVTVLLAKNSQRYRLQSNSAASLNVLVQQLIQRLKKHFENKPDFSVLSSSALPVVPFLEVIQEHFIKRKTVNDLQNQLSELSSQFRLIQKRLITKFKDKNPTLLNNLDIFMLQTYNEIITCSESYQDEKEEFLKIQCKLSCVIHLIVTLLEHSDVPEEMIKHISSIFVTPICDIEEQGWEDVIEICMSHLFRTVIARSEKDRLKNTTNSLEHVKDISKFKKRITQLLDRALKTTDVQENFPLEEKATSPTTEALEALTQVGSKIAVSSVRVQSAKLARLKLLSTPEEVEEDI